MMMCIQNLVRFYEFVLKILSGNEILTSIKGRNSIKILHKMTCNNPKLDLINADVHRPGLILIVNHDYFYLIEIFLNRKLFFNHRFL